VDRVGVVEQPLLPVIIPLSAGAVDGLLVDLTGCRVTDAAENTK
jgi:hypothetical protein